MAFNVAVAVLHSRTVSVTGMWLRSLGTVLAALVLAGCASEFATGGERLVELDASARPSRPVSGEPVRWVLELTNPGDEPAAVAFPTTQRGDVRLSEAGVDVYHWAEPRAFSVVQEVEVILAGETVSFHLDDDRLAVPPGEYEILASVRAIEVNRVVRETVTVRPKRR